MEKSVSSFIATNSKAVVSQDEKSEDIQNKRWYFIYASCGEKKLFKQTGKMIK